MGWEAAVWDKNQLTTWADLRVKTGYGEREGFCHIRLACPQMIGILPSQAKMNGLIWPNTLLAMRGY